MMIEEYFASFDNLEGMMDRWSKTILRALVWEKLRLLISNRWC